ncbi:MAG TPA: hypothetical protein VJJ23_00445 [Candidatus Nanoarchaeia archaeon]|nr:hypothetical protein [Candidatus Nanoarchaeia archaeon]
MPKEQNYIRILPSGNASEFPAIDSILDRLGVKHEVKQLRTGGRIYRISSDEIKKLPIDHETKEPYLPVCQNSGHSVYLDKDNNMWQDFNSE